MDNTERKITEVCAGNLPFNSKMKMLVVLEAEIVSQYASGLTEVKPIHLLTPDDLID